MDETGECLGRFFRAFALPRGLLVADAVGEGEPHQDEGDHPQGPLAPVRHVLRPISSGETPGVQEGHDGRAQVHEPVDDAHGDARVLRAAEVHARRAGEHAVDADDGERHEHEHEEDERAPQKCRHGEGADEKERVEDGCDGTAARLEDVVRDGPREQPSKDPRRAQEEPPVHEHEVVREADLLAEDLTPLHGGLADEPRAELDAGDRHDDAASEHHLEHLDRVVGPAVVARGRVGRREVLEPGFARTVPDGEDPHDRHHEQKRCGDEEHQIRPSGEDVEEEPVPVVGEVDAQGDQDPEDGAEHATLAQVEPGSVALDDRDGAERLEVHVPGVEDGDRVQEDGVLRRERLEPEESSHGVLHVEEKREDGGADGAGRLREGTRLEVVVEHLEGHGAQEQVHHYGAESAHQDGGTRAEAVREGAVQDEREPVHERADPEDEPEVGVVHQVDVAERVLAHGQVVAPHVQERVDEPEREPVHGASPSVGRRVRDVLDLGQAGDHEHDEREEPEEPRKLLEGLRDGALLGRLLREGHGWQEGDGEREQAGDGTAHDLSPVELSHVKVRRGEVRLFWSFLQIGGSETSFVDGRCRTVSQHCLL